MTAEEHVLRRNIAASGLTSAQWERVPAGIRERAFFSSRVESARFLETARSRIADLLANRRDADGAFASRGRVVADIMRAAREAGIAGGTRALTDPGSVSRARVIVDTNAGLAAGYAQAELGGSLGARMAFPAQELLRFEERLRPRDWTARWTAAGGRLYDGRMVALKGDPVWTGISRFGLPYPPFDYNSGMGVEDVSYDEAVELGVIEEGYRPPEETPLQSFNEGLEADLRLPPGGQEWQKLKEAFGDQMRMVDGKAVWRSEIVRETFDTSHGEKGRMLKLGTVTNTALAKVPHELADLLTGTKGERMGLTLTKELITHVKNHNHYKDDPRAKNNPVMPHDLDMLPTLWRSPDRILPGHGAGLVFELDITDGTLVLPVLRRGNTLMAGTLYKRKER